MDDWKEQLPEELRGLPMMEKFKSVEDLVRSHSEAEKMLGSSVRVPSSEAGDDAWKEFLAKMPDGVAKVPTDPDDDEGWRHVLAKAGLPEDPTGYELSDAELAKQLHEAGLTKRQAKKVAATMNADKEAQQTKRQEETQQAVAKLREKWGEGFDRMSLQAKQAVDVLAANLGMGEEFRAKLADSRYGNDPFLIEVFAEVGKMMGEKAPFKGGSGGVGLTPAEAQEQISEIMANEDHPYHQGDKASVEKVTRLFEVIHGKEQMKNGNYWAA